MSDHRARPLLVEAVAHEVLPTFGVAFLVDGHDTTWTVTRCTQGPGLDALHAGQRVRLTLEHHLGFSVVAAYAPLS
jgi:hypothetical protein